MVDANKLTKSLAKDLNKRIKSLDKVAYFLTPGEMTPTDIHGWVSTGCTALDLAISNRPNGGLPVGRITEITGLEASGKSLIAAHCIKSTQQAGGIGVYIDTETAVHRDFMKAIGVDLNTMVYANIQAIEDVFEATESIIEQVRKQDKDTLVTIVIDSVMGASVRSEIAGEYGIKGWNTEKAIVISEAMRKITTYLGRERVCLILTNQLREKLGVAFGDKYTTSGGKAIGFHASVRLRLKSVGAIKNKSGDVIGIKTRADVFKNRVGPPRRTVDYDIYYASGIDDYGSWLKILKDKKLVTQGGSWYTYVDTDPNTGEVLNEFKFQSKDFYSKVLKDPEVRNRVYNAICESMIIEYEINSENEDNERAIGIDDVEVTDDFIPENES